MNFWTLLLQELTEDAESDTYFQDNSAPRLLTYLLHGAESFLRS
jgi:hypothetical protein